MGCGASTNSQPEVRRHDDGDNEDVSEDSQSTMSESVVCATEEPPATNTQAGPSSSSSANARAHSDSSLYSQHASQIPSELMYLFLATCSAIEERKPNESPKELTYLAGQLMGGILCCSSISKDELQSQLEEPLFRLFVEKSSELPLYIESLHRAITERQGKHDIPFADVAAKWRDAELDWYTITSSAS